MRKKKLQTPPIACMKLGLLKTLQTKSYANGTLANYRRTLTTLESYMHNNRIDKYTPMVGTTFITDYLSEHNLDISRQKAIVTMINRLNDYCNGTNYAIQRKQKIAPLRKL